MVCLELLVGAKDFAAVVRRSHRYHVVVFLHAPIHEVVEVKLPVMNGVKEGAQQLLSHQRIDSCCVTHTIRLRRLSQSIECAWRRAAVQYPMSVTRSNSSRNADL